ncbi:hypothetical protein NDU88_006835 [Pleurodeles waltl]|uniref:Uncharacterized protein n=1 Tax=Pleurodeles waltl TaxID=8319 RepID=A0AAV7LRU2_PLEWA|nr:hypothetical protein NDU88_006835 [Pleurodeles waltl]
MSVIQRGDGDHNALKLEMMGSFEPYPADGKFSLLKNAVLSNNKAALKWEYVQAHPKILEQVYANVGNALEQLNTLHDEDVASNLIINIHEDLFAVMMCSKNRNRVE